MRLPSDHPLNQPNLVASIELVIADGKLEAKPINGSGNHDYDTAIAEILREVSPGTPPAELESDDGRVHVRWIFARDRRQAGPATAEVMVIVLPLLATTQRLLQRAPLVRAAMRVAAAVSTDPERLGAAELVMIAALREGLASADGATREAALEAVASTKLAALAQEVQQLVGANGQTQRVRAIATAAALGDASVAPALVDGLVADFEDRPEVAIAKVEALVVLGHGDEARSAVRAILGDTKLDGSKHTRAIATAIAALAFAPDAKLVLELPGWFARGDAEIRQAVCAAAVTSKQAANLIARGLHDADASVRASCASIVPRIGKQATMTERLLVLVRDRDEAVRARAVAALGVLGFATHARGGLDDRAASVRAAAATAADEAELRTLAKDKDPDVRAAAIDVLAKRGAQVGPAKVRSNQGSDDAITAAAHDTASQVRKAAIAGITDDALLETLAGDSDPEVATAALARFATRQGRMAVTTAFLQRLVAATPKSLERVRIARAWLLAR